MFLSSRVTAGTWTPLANQAPAGIGLMLLQPDGTVMCAAYGGSSWWRLTPDDHGSYVRGTWSAMAAMNYTRLYYSSQVLPCGKVLVAGGEYGSGGPYAEMYDPQANIWTVLPGAPGVNNFIDSISETLPNGDVIIAPVSPANYGGTVIWNTASNNWSVGPTLYRGDDQDEASWVKLPDESILTIDPFGQESERYIPSLNQWVNDSDVPVAMYGYGGELGAGFLLPNGNAFYIGGTDNTAIYTPSGTTVPGVWTAGATIPDNLGAVDAPAAMMANGNILCQLGPDGGYDSPTYFYEYNYLSNTFTAEPSPGGGTSFSPVSFACIMLDLPDGTVLFSYVNSQLYDYQPGGNPVTSGVPTISSVSTNLDGSFHLTGMRLNGISEGAAYGDDNQMASDYPIVHITDLAGNIRYCRTYNWSGYSVMTGTNILSTEVMLPAGLPAGTYPLIVTANGISSAPYSLTIPGTPLAPVTGLSFSAVAPTQISVQWNAIGSTETGYVVQRSTDGILFSTVANLTTNTLAYTDTAVTPLGQYYYKVQGTNAYGSGNATTVFTASPPTSPVPAPWQNQDLGPVLGRGATGGSAGGFIVIGAGDGLGGTNDQFQSCFQPVAGDVTVTARVVTSQSTGANALTGVMVRNSLDAGAANALMAFGGGSGSVVFQTRGGDGNVATGNSTGNMSMPCWVRIVRSGNAITGFTSPDGSRWTQQGSATGILSPTIYVGLAVSSGTSNLLNTTTFDQVTLVGAAATDPIPVAEWKLDETVGTVATDSRGSYNGTYNSVALGRPGATPTTGYSAAFNGTNADITVPPLNLNSNVVTITGWLNPNGYQNAGTGIFYNRANSTVSGLNFFNAANEIGYTWNADPNSYNWPSGLVIPTNQWTFLALVVEPTRARIFMATNGVFSSATNNISHAVQAFDGDSDIGLDPISGTRYFNGQLDEVQFFNQALTPAQLAGMASAPVIALTSPDNGSTYPVFAGINLSVSISATSGHTLDSVQYFNNQGQLLGESATSPFSVTATNLNTGAFTLFARLFYDGGFSVNSSLNSVGVFIQTSSTNTWDANGLATGPQDGNGKWDDGSLNWWNGTGNGAWTDDTVAVFGSGMTTNCTVTLSTNVAPYAITFNANAGGTYTLTGTNAILLNIPGTPLTITANANATIGASLVGPNGLVKQGSGTLTLTASNNYSGPTLVNAGILQLGTNTALGSSVNVASGGSLDLNGQDLTTSMFGLPVSLGGTVGGAMALTNSSPSRGQLQDVQLSADTTITGPNTVYIRGTSGENGLLHLNGHNMTIAGNLLLDGVNMTGPGNLTVESGTLQLIDYYGQAQRDTTLAGTGNLTINAGAAVMTYRWGSALNLSMPLILNGGMLGSGWPGPNGAVFTCPILVNSNSIIDFDGGYGSGILAGNITGPGGLTVTGDSNVRSFTGTNSYGWTTINGGTLQIGYGGSSGTLGRGCVTNNANLVFNRTGFMPVTNQISGPGALFQNGAGTVALYGTNTYTGSTTVNAGTLLVNGAIAGGPVTVAAQGTLGGSGTLYGPTMIQSGGLFQPGCSNLATLTLNNTLSLNGNALFALNRTNAQTASKIAGLSTVTCGGTLTVTNVGPNTFASGDTFTLLQAANYTGTFTNLSLPVLPAGLAWNTSSLLVDGTLSVTGTFAGPALSSALVKGKLQLTFSGDSNQTYRVLAGTNLLQPMASWVVLTNGTFAGSPVIFTNAGLPGFPFRFYRIATP